MQERIDIKAKVSRRAFDSMREFSQWIGTTPRVWPEDASVSERASERWDLSLGYAGALDMAANGWLEGAQRAQRELRTFTPANPAPAMVTDFYGHMPHVPRYCAGAPDCMIRHANPPRFGEGKVLTLYVPLSANCYTDARHMANYGLGVAQYVNQLEAEGTRCEVWAVFSSYRLGADWRATESFKVKSAEQPLDLAVMSFAIGHPAAFRRLSFAANERLPRAAYKSNYGQAVRAKISDLIDPAHGAVILNGMITAEDTATTPGRALEAIGKEIETAIELQWRASQ